MTLKTELPAKCIGCAMPVTEIVEHDKVQAFEITFHTNEFDSAPSFYCRACTIKILTMLNSLIFDMQSDLGNHGNETMPVLEALIKYGSLLPEKP